MSTDGKAGYEHQETPTLAGVLSDLRHDLNAFVQTRLQLLIAESRQKIAAWRLGVLVLAAASIFALTGFLLLTGVLVSVVALAFGVSFALLIVGALYLIIAAGAAWGGYRELSSQRVPPERTLQMLKEDQAWLQNQDKAA